MTTKNILISFLTIAGIYFLLFHTPPFPFSHEAIGLPPFHLLHAGFGVALLASALYLKNKK